MGSVNTGGPGTSGWWSQTRLVLAKDLEIEWRSRNTMSGVLPFAGVLIVLFAIAFDPDRGLLPRLGPGIFWVCVLLAALLAIGRAFAIERDNRAGAGLMLSGVDPAAMFLGKTLALLVELLVLEAVLATAMAAVYGISPRSIVPLAGGAVLASAGIASAGTLYGALSVAGRGRDTLLAVLLLPVLVPVLLAATRVFEAGTDGGVGGEGAWLGLLAVFAVLYCGLGLISFGTLMEET